MKERPVIFNSEMVRAILDGRKTQTRRVIANVSPDNCIPLHKPTKTKDGIYTHVMDAPGHGLCPFGQVGDRLWVRETFAVLGNEDGCPIDWDGNLIKGDEKHAARIYKASCWQEPGNYGLWSIPDRDTQYEGAWRPSIHMPRWASRMTLEITAVRVERLNSIGDVEAMREGIQNLTTCSHADFGIPGVVNAQHPVRAFQLLWESIYGEESWSANPWVWVIEFRRVGGA
ncbi:ASCH domain-containing protein [Serratia marcescens]|uniref:hypothetical protein n=1 Tax=Serratia marcescens TaxID=615 RepID=UPI000744F4FF|nr:hypothetical protein [Serratia marcescens]MBN3904746.1 hypothetical protein [Serratia marcescens]MBN3916309.1 hypothetical protein [Serratia marcescens]MBN3921338.1 hypothetical protein [Serratia marcescens]MBN3938053.1 hypothetical protein [Serratia marcescens]MBN3957039.1 hypothetical protein [Serratia marcescens]